MESAKRIADKKDWIKGATGDWEIIVGLEVHAQVLSKAKLFSGASAEFGGAPNDHVSIVDAAMPGMLPVINNRDMIIGRTAKFSRRAREQFGF